MHRSAIQLQVQTSGQPAYQGRKYRGIALMGLVAGLYIWSAIDLKISPGELIDGWPMLLDIISRMFPPSLAILPDLLAPTLETLQISLWGTTIAVFLTLPVGFLAARNLSPHPAIYHASRFITNAARSIHEIIFALVFVAAVGLGPYPGVLALGFHSMGMMGKFLADSIEGIDPGPVEALKASGANALQIVRFAVIPQIMPEFVGLCLYRLELNFRSATVLGIVGAGGIGFELITSLRLFKYPNTTTILLVILLTVIVVDYACSRIRQKLI